MRTTLLGLTIAALLLGACARRPTEAERNAEIERRVEQRLAQEHQAEAEQRLALRAAALEAREKLLAAEESSFANMTASTAPATVSPTAETATDYRGDESATAYYPYATNELYPEQYGLVPQPEPAFVDEPCYFAPASPVLSVFNQSAAIVYLNRNAPRMRPRRHHPGFHQPPPRPRPRPRQMGTGHQRVTRPPMRTAGQRSTGAARGRQMVNRARPAAPRRPR